MRTRTLLVPVILYCLTVWAADKIQPLDIKMGLWEMTHTTSMAGMPSIPPEVLANMTPEQQAMMAATMKKQGGQRPMVEKECITKEKLEKNNGFDNDNKDCTRTVVSSSGNKMEMKIQCSRDGRKMDGTFRIDVVNSENLKGTIQVASVDATHPIKVNSSFTAKWLGPVCGSASSTSQ